MTAAKLARRIVSITESVTLALNARMKQLAAEGTTVYNLTASELAVETPGYIQAAGPGTLHQRNGSAAQQPRLSQQRHSTAGQ